ncbi:MAG: hypothetical protein ABI367_15405 [Mucilaginibacter sp.]
MLRITVPQNGQAELTFAKFESYGLPKPINGVDTEADNVVLLFDDEQDAIDYADRLIEYVNNMDDDVSPKRVAISDVIVAIKSDAFVQTYLDN